MVAARHSIWKTISFYKAYLPPSEAIKALGYVVLALEDNVSVSSNAHLNGDEQEEEMTMGTLPARCCTPPQKNKSFTYSADICTVTHQDLDTQSRSSNDANFQKNMCNAFRFFLFKREDVSPPHLKQMLGKTNFCFELCHLSLNGKECRCHKTHLLNTDAWRLELSTFDIEELFVSKDSSVHRIKTNVIKPTAGLFFACGLLHENIVEVVQPIICRFYNCCRHGSLCLFIHADIYNEELVPLTAALPLKNQLKAQPNLSVFVAYLDDLQLLSVGDVQQLSDNAFDAIVSRSEPCWLSNWLNIAAIRDIQPKSALVNVLATFPGITFPLSLPQCLTTVSSLLKLRSREFYSLVLPLPVQAACEKIRARFESDRGYDIIHLQKEPKTSFFNDVTMKILSFRGKHADASWRKNDPNRPVVTSLITYVDFAECFCRAGGNEHMSPIVLLGSNASNTSSNFPWNSWCTCRRHYEIAVNYELSTPSGSRCSEQNVMGKLASVGAPTSAVREVFVHGENKGSTKDPNPLFPCGVCENMLRRVTRDVHAVHGGDVMLYMFDSTLKPKRLVYLSISEISHRDGKSFKKFIEDLREE